MMAPLPLSHDLTAYRSTWVMGCRGRGETPLLFTLSPAFNHDKDESNILQDGPPVLTTHNRCDIPAKYYDYYYYKATRRLEN